MNLKFVVLGVLFAALWASASPAAKLALSYIEPLLMFQIRFFSAGTLLIVFARLIRKERLPYGQEWLQIAIFGFLNTTLYLSLFILALGEISAGIGSLATSTNTLLISVLSTFWLREKIQLRQWVAVFTGLGGVIVACYPLLLQGHATPRGLLLIFLSMLSYSVGTIYYSKVKWTLSRITINGWQVFLGGIFMLPLTLLFHRSGQNQWNATVGFSILWLVLPVSIAAVQLWLYLLKTNTVKASYFLFLCPIFGFIYANLLLNEPLSGYTWGGTALVLGGLYLGSGKVKN